MGVFWNLMWFGDWSGSWSANVRCISASQKLRTGFQAANRQMVIVELGNSISWNWKPFGILFGYILPPDYRRWLHGRKARKSKICDVSLVLTNRHPLATDNQNEPSTVIRSGSSYWLNDDGIFIMAIKWNVWPTQHCDSYSHLRTSIVTSTAMWGLV